MTTHKLPSGATVKTNAKRRFLVVAQYRDVKPTVDSSHDTSERAIMAAGRNATAFPFTDWYALDQVTGDVTGFRAYQDGK